MFYKCLMIHERPQSGLQIKKQMCLAFQCKTSLSNKYMLLKCSVFNLDTLFTQVSEYTTASSKHTQTTLWNVVQHSMHQALECGRCIFQAKRHQSILI